MVLNHRDVCLNLICILLREQRRYRVVAQCNRTCYTHSERNETMNTLHVRSVPDNLYNRLQQLAQSKNRSLSAQVLTLLEQALDIEERRKKQAKVLSSIQRRRFTAPKNAPASLELLKEDRTR